MDRRWKRDGRPYAPHVVLLGFLASDVPRNVNLVRLLMYGGSGIPFSKPRFVLEGSELPAVNVPCLSLEGLGAVLPRFGDWELSRYESFYRPADYERRWWTRSRLASSGTRPCTRPSPSVTNRSTRPALRAHGAMLSL